MNANHLGNVLTTISDRKKRLAGTTPAFEAVIETAQDYYPFGSLMPGRKYNAGEYRFGFNGQEKDDEIAGVTGSHTTALFWEYDTRLGRRWNLDPKPQIHISDYSCFANNPILYNDPLGDTVRTNSEGASNTKMGIDAILDKQTNPIGFDENKGMLTYDDKVDISGYTDFQKDVLGRYQELISNKTDINLKIVDVNEKVDDLGNKSIGELNGAGYNRAWINADGSINKVNVYVARNPIKLDGSSERKEYAGVTNLHELGGHAFLRLTKPALKVNDHNKLVEDFQKQIFLNYKINGAIWYKRSEVPIHPREEE